MNNIPTYIKNYESLIFRFCLFDDCCKDFFPKYQSYLISNDKILRKRNTSLTMAEVMTLVVEFHYSKYRDFKAFYHEYVLSFLKPLFPSLCSYNRFVRLAKRAIMPLFYCLNNLMTKCSGISFVDSTPLRVCRTKRTFNHKVFKNIASLGKSTMGWFFGFKLHLVVDDQGNLLSFTLTPGNTNDRAPLGKLSKNLFGKLFADKGYISSKWFMKLLSKGLKLITGIKTNMKNKLMTLIDKIYLRKRSLIETINDHLKNVCQIEHSRHRSPINFLVNLFSALIAYQLNPKKPKLNLTNSELKLLPSHL